MSTTRQRMPARDYKNASSRQPVFDFARYRQFGAGLAVGLVVALFVWIHGQDTLPVGSDDPDEVIGPDEVMEAPAAASEADSTDGVPADYAFFKTLPDFVVEVPDRSARRPSQPIAPVVKPGTYVMQAGAFRDIAGAKQRLDMLDSLDIEASILHVSDDTNELHVVRIGPLRDLDRINAIQRKLHAAGIDAFLQRAGD